MLLQLQEHNKIINGSITISFIDGGGFCFFIILPQQRRQKKEKNFINSLKRGDRVITKSGIHGKVMELNDSDEKHVSLKLLRAKLKWKSPLYHWNYHQNSRKNN